MTFDQLFNFKTAAMFGLGVGVLILMIGSARERLRPRHATPAHFVTFATPVGAVSYTYITVGAGGGGSGGRSWPLPMIRSQPRQFEDYLP